MLHAGFLGREQSQTSLKLDFTATGMNQKHGTFATSYALISYTDIKSHNYLKSKLKTGQEKLQDIFWIHIYYKTYSGYTGHILDRHKPQDIFWAYIHYRTYSGYTSFTAITFYQASLVQRKTFSMQKNNERRVRLLERLQFEQVCLSHKTKRSLLINACVLLQPMWFPRIPLV